MIDLYSPKTSDTHEKLQRNGSMSQEESRNGGSYLSHYGLVVEVARLYAPNADLVHDIAQETYRIFLQGEKEGKWNFDNDNLPLLWQIAKNVAMLHWREYQKKSPESLRKLNDYLVQLRRERNLIDEIVEEESRSEDVKILTGCLKKISEKMQRMVDMRYFKNLSIPEIAEHYQVEAKTIQQALRRVREKIRICIERNRRHE